MSEQEGVYKKRSSVDRRTALRDRRILDMRSGCPGPDRRKNDGDRRRMWEDRYGWERINQWSSAPIYSELP